MTTITTKYKNPQMQRAFDGVLAAARAHDKALFSEDGGMRRGSSQACGFWDGYLGKKVHTIQPGSLASAAYAAGKQFKKEHHDHPHH